MKMLIKFALVKGGYMYISKHRAQKYYRTKVVNNSVQFYHYKGVLC